MTGLVTLAHRVSKIHAGYSDIHTAVFSFSFARVRSAWLRRGADLESCKREKELEELNKQLDEIIAIVRGGSGLDLSTTFYREFSGALDDYVKALAICINSLQEICARQCLDQQGRKRYEEAQARGDRIAYDRSVQHYQRLGERLNRLFKLL